MSDDRNRGAISKTIDQYFSGLASGDLSGIPLTSDVEFQGALDPTPMVGSDAVRTFLRTFSDAIERIDVHDKVIDGQIACVTFTWIAVSGAHIPMCDYFRFEGDKIAYLRPYFDTRLLTGG